MRKILIGPSNTDLNRGDQALVWESIELCKDLDKNTQFYLYRSGLTDKEKKDQSAQTERFNYIFLEKILAHPGRGYSNKSIGISKMTFLKWGFKAVCDIVITLSLLSKWRFLNSFGLLFLSKGQRRTLEFFKTEMDYLFIKGGGFLHSYGKITDPYIMYFQLFDIFLAAKYNKKIFILPNSIGPLKNWSARFIVRKALSLCSLITVRESVSYDLIKSLNLSVPLEKFPDLGFYLNPSNMDFVEYLRIKGIDLDRKRIAVTMRPYRFENVDNPREKYVQYITNMSCIVKCLLEDNIQVCLVAHTLGPSKHEDDRIALKDVLCKVGSHENLFYIEEPSWDCKDIERFYSYFDITIGTRFHSVIFSLNMIVPAIAIAYGGNKARGIMKDLDVEKFVVDMENVDSNYVLYLVDKIYTNMDSYKKRISNYKNNLLTQRESLLSKIKNNNL